MTFSPQHREPATYSGPLTSKRAATDVADVVSVSSRLAEIERKVDLVLAIVLKLDHSPTKAKRHA
jgi:hypothetical protein